MVYNKTIFIFLIIIKKLCLKLKYQLFSWQITLGKYKLNLQKNVLWRRAMFLYRFSCNYSYIHLLKYTKSKVWGYYIFFFFSHWMKNGKWSETSFRLKIRLIIWQQNSLILILFRKWASIFLFSWIDLKM
jgi:hypothetical protein